MTENKETSNRLWFKVSKIPPWAPLKSPNIWKYAKWKLIHHSFPMTCLFSATHVHSDEIYSHSTITHPLHCCSQSLMTFWSASLRLFPVDWAAISATEKNKQHPFCFLDIFLLFPPPFFFLWKPENHIYMSPVCVVTSCCQGAFHKWLTKNTLCPGSL